MRNSKRNGFIKSLTSVLAVVLMLALMLTGCTDKEAQSLANTAQGVADKAQESADDANSLAQSAQNKTEENKKAIEALEKAVSQLASSEKVAEIISQKLADYVSNDALTTELTKYVTLTYLEQQFKTDVNGAITSAVATLKSELQVELDKKIDAAVVVKTVLESNEFKDAVNQAVTGYVAEATFNTAIDGVNGKIAALEKLLLGENYASGTVEGVVGGIYGDIDSLEDKLGELTDDVNGILDPEKGLAAAFGKEISRVEGIIADLEIKLQDALKQHVDDYNEATEYILNNDFEFDKLLADYEAKKAQYTDTVYDLIVKNINDNRVRFRRALKKDCGEGEHNENNLCCATAILASVIDNAASQKNLAQVLADALDAVYYVEINGTKYVVIEDLNGKDANSSRTGLKAAEEVLATITAQDVEAVASSYLDPNTEQYRDLVEETHELRAAVDKLDLIKSYAETNVIAAINAITGSVTVGTDNYVDGAFAAVTVDLTKVYLKDPGTDADRDALKAKFDTAALAIDDYIATQFNYDDSNPNITRLVNNWERYYAADTRIDELEALDAEVAAYVAEIATLLTAKAYNVTAIGEANYLYSDHTELKALADEVAEWLEDYVSTEDNYADVITNYDDDATATSDDLDIVYAVDYAEDMVAKFDEAHAENGVVAKIDAILAKAISIDFYAEYYEAYDALQTWKTDVDDKNIEAIINYVEVATLSTEGRLAQFEALKPKYDALKNAYDTVNAPGGINDKIADLVELMENGEITIGTMSAQIRPLRNEIVGWLNAANIAIPTQETPDLLIRWILNANTDRSDVAYTVTGVDYVAENWNMLEHEDFLDVLEAYDEIVADVIDYADDKVVPLFVAIQNNPLFALPTDGSYDYILYFKNDIQVAMDKYLAWVGVYHIDATELKTYDLGESYKLEQSYISEQLLKLLAANDRCVATLAQAQSEYDGFKTLLDEALDDSYTVGIMANKIPEAFEKADAWYDYYIYDAEGYKFNEVIKAYTGILTEDEYKRIVAKNLAYENLVAEALADYQVFKDMIDTITVGDYDVYDAAFIQNLLIGSTDNLIGAWTWKVLATMSKYGVSGEQTELLTTFQSANMDERFNTDVEGGINMVTLIEKFAKIYGGPSNPDSYEYFINQLVAEAEGIRTTFDSTFTSSYTVNIYSRKLLTPIREAYNAWATKGGMANDTAAYDDDRISSLIAPYIELLNDINDMDDDIAELEGHKNQETTDVIALIEGLASIGGSNKVTTLNRTQIMTAYNAYNAWYTGDFNKDGVLDEADVYKIDDMITDMYVISDALKTTLKAYHDALADLDAKIDAISGLVDAIPDAITDPVAYQDAITAAKNALNEYFAANDGNTDGIDAEVAGAIAEAEIKLAIYNAVNDPANASIVDLENKLNNAADLMIGSFYTESADPDAPVNQYEANKGDVYFILSNNFGVIIDTIIEENK